MEDRYHEQLENSPRILDNPGALRYNTLNVVIKGYYALNLKEGICHGR